MKEYKTPLGSFIGGWIIDRKICEDLIKFFEKKKKRQKNWTSKKTLKIPRKFYICCKNFVGNSRKSGNF